MKLIESKVFIGIRGVYFAFTLLFYLNMSSGIQEKMTSALGMNIFGIIFAVYIAKNYELGKNWARIWMVIANYGGIFLLVRDLASFSDLTKYSRFESWANLGLAVDTACIIASIYVIVQLHKKKNQFRQSGTIQRGDPGEHITKLKEMMDKGLITNEEYEKKRAEIFERM